HLLRWWTRQGSSARSVAIQPQRHRPHPRKQSRCRGSRGALVRPKTSSSRQILSLVEGWPARARGPWNTTPGSAGGPAAAGPGKGGDGTCRRGVFWPPLEGGGGGPGGHGGKGTKKGGGPGFFCPTTPRDPPRRTFAHPPPS